MRFFLDLFSCGGSTLRSPDSAASTKPLAPRASRSLRRKKRDGPDWRPSLGSISEDGAVARSDRGSGTDLKGRNTGDPAVVAAAASSKVHHRRNYSDDYDYGRGAMPTVIPPFAPTPFMF